jgi:cytochrome bd-type quinol oxidase subunit 1
LSGLAPPWVVMGFGVQSIAYLVLVLVVLPVSYWKLDTPTDRRRFRVIVYGALTSMLFYLPRVIGTALLNVSPGFYAFFDLPAVNVIYTAGMLILPFSFAYAILKQRLFDVRVIIRRGVQYALARRVLLAIPVVTIGLEHGEEWLQDACRYRCCRGGIGGAGVNATAEVAFRAGPQILPRQI